MPKVLLARLAAQLIFPLPPACVFPGSRWASRYLGVLDVDWDTEEGLLSASGAPLLLGGANSTNPVAGAVRAPPPPP